MHVFVRLNGNLPFRVRQNIVSNQGHHLFPAAPFRLQVAFAAGVQLCGVRFGPLQIFFSFNDDFHFIGLAEKFGADDGVFLGRKANPFPFPA